MCSSYLPRSTKATYAAPCLYKTTGRSPELVFTNWQHGVTAVDPRTGKTTWEISVFDPKNFETSIASPFVANGLIFATCGYLGRANHTVAVRPDRANPGKGVEVFRIERGAPLTATPVVKDDLLFLWSDEGIVTCTDSRNGNVFWKKRVGGTYYGSPVVVGEALYCLSTAGDAVVLAASKQYKFIARNPLGEPSHATPSVADGAMYLRTLSHLISIGGRRLAVKPTRESVGPLPLATAGVR